MTQPIQSTNAAGVGSAILQILSINPIKRGTREGRDWELQDAECILLNEDGTPSQVGVLMLPKHLRGDDAPLPGVYSGSFVLRPDLRTRRIEAVLVGLRPYLVKPQTPVQRPGPAEKQ